MSMHRIAASVAIGLTLITVVTCQFRPPCDSPLRSFSILASYFAHCECVYSNWTEWTTPINAISIPVPRSQCDSEMARPEERWQTVISGYECENNRSEERYTCECVYSNWTEWATPINATSIPVPRNQCDSEMARPEERWPTIISGYECDLNRSEVRHICEPGRAERLFTILDLGIGGRIGPNSHLNLARGGHIGPNSHGSGYQFKHQASSDSGGGGGGIGAKDHCVHKEVCTSSHQPLGRRSLEEEMKPPRRNKPHKSPEPKPLPTDPLPFNFAEHGTRYKRSYYDNCQDDAHYVLFILDTSASIGSSNFSRMTATLSRLVHQFCKPVKVAAMTFSDELYVEFCFNCFDNTCEGRRLLRDAMCNIPYRSGWTHTGAATQCACNTILTHECGFLDSDASGYRCLDIVYITDGQSNGPLDVCKEVDCFYNLPNVHIEVIAIGITNYDEDEINCIGMPPGEDSATAADRLFQFSDFDDFNNVIAHAEEYLFEISPLQCFSVPDGFSISEPCVSDDVC